MRAQKVNLTKNSPYRIKTFTIKLAFSAKKKCTLYFFHETWFFLSRQDFEQKSNCWKSTGFSSFSIFERRQFWAQQIYFGHFFKITFLCPVNFQRKILLMKCVLLFIFCTFIRKNLTAAEIISERMSKLPFPCQEQLFAKDSFPWKTYNFSINFCFHPIKLRFSAKSLQQSCQNCIVWCP